MVRILKTIKDNQNFGEQQYTLKLEIYFLLFILLTKVVVSSESIYFNFVFKDMLQKCILLSFGCLRQQEAMKLD